MKSIAFFVSGRGGFLRFALKNLSLLPDAKICCIVTDRSGADIADVASEYGLPVFPVSYKGRAREDIDAEIVSILKPFNIDLVILNYNRLLGAVMIAAYPEIYNLHLSLLPLHKGFGAIEAAYHGKDFFYGVTMHRVDASTDGGPIVAQVAIPRDPAASLEDVTQDIFRYGCLLQLDVLHRLTSVALEKHDRYQKALFNPGLTIDAALAEAQYRGVAERKVAHG